jgi:chitinase
MSLRRCLTFVLALLPVAATAGDFIFGDSFDPPWVSGYYVGYQKDLYPIADVDFAALTHLFVGRIWPNNDGTLVTTFDIDAVNGPIFAKGAADAAHAAGVKVVLMVGGAGVTSWSSAASATYRTAFVSNLLNAMDAYHMDGLDLDWEPFYDTDEANMTALAQALRAARPGLILTVPVGWVNANFPDTTMAYYASVASLFDQINIMSYGMAADWPGWVSWHSSALGGEGGDHPSSISSSVAYFLGTGVPSQRLGIGIGFYGECWQGVTGPLQTGGTEVADDNVMSYTNIMASYYSAARAHWDATAQVPYLGSSTAFGSQACKFVSYDDPQSIAAKGAYVHQNHLGGTIIWTIAEGYLPTQPLGQRDPLMEALRTSFLYGN